MLFNANSGHSNCASGVPCGGHAWSKNGIDWDAPYWPAFGPIVHYDDNSTIGWDYVERPQVVQDDDGTPLTLFLSQSGRGSGTHAQGYVNSHSLAIMFCQPGDAA